MTEPQASQFWIASITPSNFEIARTSLTWALGENKRSFTFLMKKGDGLILYLATSRPPSFAGAFRIAGDWYTAPGPLWDDEKTAGKILYPHQVKVELLQLGAAEYFKLVPQLRFIDRKELPKRYLGTYLQGSPSNFGRPVTREDFELILNELRANPRIPDTRGSKKIEPQIMLPSSSDTASLLASKDREILELRKQIEELERKLDQSITPISEASLILRNPERYGFVYFEWGLAKAFNELGFQALWNGKEADGKPVQNAPKGYPDVEVEAPQAGEPYYLVVEGTKIETGLGQVMEVGRAVLHDPELTAKSQGRKVYKVLIAPHFTEQVESYLNRPTAEQVLLVDSNTMAELLNFHRKVGGITQEEVRRLLDRKEKGTITREMVKMWEAEIENEREQLALLLRVYHILYEANEWMTTDTIQWVLGKETKKKVSEKTIKDALEVLKVPVIASVTEKEIDGKPKFRATMTPQTFGLRVRKLEEEILKGKMNSKSGLSDYL